MATINFKGKEIVRNHHLTIPYHELVPDAKKSFPPKAGRTAKVGLNDNLIIHGDNLLALKALLPTYAGKVKCIYIDPPYNTGNEKWAYNDNVNSPMMKEWLGKVVDKDDLTRHDKWLCMMMPRLKLLRELLREDGVIFVSIDDNELNNLKLVMDEIFDDQNFIACIVAQLNPRGRTLDRFLAKTHEYILLYAKNAANDNAINLLSKEGAMLATYNKKDEVGTYRELELRNRNPVFNKENRPNLYYPIYVNPKNRLVSLKKDNDFSVEVFPRNSQGIDGCWTWGKTKVSANTRLLIAGQTSVGKWRIFRKDYLYDEQGESAVTKAKALWLEPEINNENGKEVCNEIFGKCPFDFPKSTELIKKCLRLGSNPKDIILDSFAGSGTTAHATLALNKEDGGNRKFILVEMEDYTDKITAERVRRVINGIKTSKDENLKKGLDGSFSYFELGKPIDTERILKGKDLPTFAEMARYIFYTATGEEFNEKKVNEKTGFIGESKEYQVYLLYKPDMEYLKSTALTLERAETLGKPARRSLGADGFTGKKRLVFAPAKYLDQKHLKRYNIDFAQLPFEIYNKAK